MRSLSSIAVTLALLLLLPGAAAAERVVSVAMDARGIEDKDYQALGLLALQRKLALRLTQAGYAVVSPGRSPHVVLGLRVEEGRLELSVKGAARPKTRPKTRQVERGEGKLETFHLEAIHRAMALVREAERALPPPGSRPASRPTSQPTSAPVKPRPRPRPPPAPRPRAEPAPWPVELAAGAMLLYRPGGVDFLGRGSGRIGVHRGLGLRGTVGLSPHVGEHLAVIELCFQGGVSWRFALARSLFIEPGLFVGLLQHNFRLDTKGSWEVEWDFLGNLSLELGWRLHRYLAVRLWLAPGISARDREHALPGDDLWERSRFRIEAGAIGVLVLR